MRRWLPLIGIGLAVVGIAVLALPFHPPLPRVVTKQRVASGAVEIVAERCPAPIVSAWRRDKGVHDGGWFGYAPLTSTPVTTTLQASCTTTARRRLAGGGLFLLCGVAVGVIGWRRRGGRPDLIVDDPT